MASSVTTASCLPDGATRYHFAVVVEVYSVKHPYLKVCERRLHLAVSTLTQPPDDETLHYFATVVGMNSVKKLYPKTFE